MTDTEFLQDKGLFLGQSEFNFSLPVPFETIVSNLKIIKEQYESIRSNPSASQDHIQEIFRALGYHVEKQDLRLIALNDIGNYSQAKVLVLLISQNENFNEMIQGLDWCTYLFYAANYHHVRWGVLTNGMELRIFDFHRADYQKTFFMADLDGIVNQGRLDDFFTIYKIFSYIRGSKGEVSSPQKNRKLPPTQEPVLSEYDLEFHTNGISQSTLDLFESLRARIFTLSDSVTEKFTKKYIGYAERKYFCEMWIQRNRVKIWVDLTIDEISDPHSLCRDVRDIGHYGSGDIEINLENGQDVDAVFEIIKKSHEKNK